MKEKNYVRIWQEEIVIPTYPTGEPNKNPLFLEKRVYQGSTGKIYPLAFIDKIYDEKVDKKYQAIFLENEYIKVTILPEIGGRIYRAYDKTNDYDFVYHNQVIKPALVGLAGPWISGGIEFNWPQHHRPSTFLPIEFKLEENEDGSKTCWVSEIDRMYGTKGMAGFTLYPDKAYIEIKGQLFNRTALPQTFLWWANPALEANDFTQSIFPPDVHAVFDHGKRDVSKFPIATGTYYKKDYSEGVDISKYKNIPVPTSYMAYKSDFNFIGGYDFSKEAGILHVADHHISPGKKQWTWGCGDFGKAWDRNLTDEDGPYVELMTGVYTDNQPDFTWLAPNEEKTFKQYFMPYKQVGKVKNANIDGAINLEIEEGKAKIIFYTTSEFNNLTVKLSMKNQEIFNEAISEVSPIKIYSKSIDLEEALEEHLYEVKVLFENGRELISYKPLKKEILKTPDPAKPALAPEEIHSNEELYLTGLHLEQYRHATYDPDSYYLEALKRDKDDVRNNNAYGLLLFRRGLFAEAEKYFNRAISTMTKRNPNPYDSEPYYNLGLSLRMQGKLDKAYDAFYKAIWNSAYQDSGYYELAKIAAIKEDYKLALEFVEKSIIKNYHNTKARNLKSILLRKLNKLSECETFTKETVKIDVLDFVSRNELYYVNKERNENITKELKIEVHKMMRNFYHNYLEASIEYGFAGFYDEAIELLEEFIAANDKGENSIYPMIYYYAGFFNSKRNNKEEALRYYKLGMIQKPDYCFPNKLEEILILEDAIKANKQDSKALYYLGNLFYDKKQVEIALKLWEESRELYEEFPTVNRNLALLYFNKLNNTELALERLEKAFMLNQEDSRVLFELDQLYKKLGRGYQERIDFLDKYFKLVEERDDIYIEYVALLNNLERYEEAKKLIESRNFHPWEGGEGKVPAQYKIYLIELAKSHMEKGSFEEAIKLLMSAKVYPHNFGEGKLEIAAENNIDYYLGCAYEGLKDFEKSNEYFEMASVGLDEPTDMMYYNDQPADMIFYQGLSLLKLGREKEAKGKFNKLCDYGEAHIFDDVKIDYFAVSLPDFLVFDEDLNKKNKLHCQYLMGLGYLGLKDFEKAKYHLNEAFKLDINHQGVKHHLQMC